MSDVANSEEEPRHGRGQAKLSVAAVKELLKGDPGGLREVVRAVLQGMLEAEMTETLGAAEGERTSARLGCRSGYYSRTLITRVGMLELRVPQDRDGRCSTELFERYQRSVRLREEAGALRVDGPAGA